MTAATTSRSEDTSMTDDTINTRSYECPQGMTLRDYFAAKAMAALIAEPLPMHTQMSGADIVAHAAYMMADAMLRIREASNDCRD